MKRFDIAILIALSAGVCACTDGNPVAPEPVVPDPPSTGKPPVTGEVAGMRFLHAINDDGAIIGAALSNGWDYVLLERTTVTHLPTIWNSGTEGAFTHAAAINSDEVIVGTGRFTSSHGGNNFYVARAVEWRKGTMRELGALPGHNWSSPGEINDAGSVVGTSGVATDGEDGCCFSQRAVLWRDGTIADLGTLDGDSWSIGISINQHDDVLVYSLPSGRSFIWSNGIVSRVSAGLLDTPGSSADVRAMNNSRQVAGNYCGPSASSCRAFLWQDGRISLLDNPMGCKGASIADMDEQGRVVGEGVECGATFSRPVAWVAGKVIELAVPQGEPGRAVGINESGLIIGWITSPSFSRGVVWQLAPGT